MIHSFYMSFEETLKGLPVKKDVTTKTIDPYFAAYIHDATWLLVTTTADTKVSKTFFGK